MQTATRGPGTTSAIAASSRVKPALSLPIRITAIGLPAGSAISTSWLSRWVPGPDDGIYRLCQHSHVASCLLPGSGADVGTGLGGVTGRHICDGSRQLADRLLIRSTR